MKDLAILNGRVYLEGEFIEANVYVEKGVVTDITTSFYDSKVIYDAGEKWVLPGFIDPHVHFELTVGPFTSVDDFRSGSISASFGGVTTFIDFLDPASSIEGIEKALKIRLEKAKKSVIDYSFHITIANPEDDPEKIARFARELELPTIKIFTTYSSTKRRTYDHQIMRLLKVSKEESVMILAHAENDEIINEGEIPVERHEESRPTIAELSEVVKLAEMTKFLDGKLYVVHVSSGLTVEEIKKRFHDIVGEDLFLESCPQYFYFTKDIYKKEKGYLYIFTPPLRSDSERKKLIDNIDVISTIGTDHCSFNKEDKLGRFTKEIPMGIGSIEFSFVLMHTLFGDKVIDKFTKNVAKIHGLYPKKGTLLPGSDADMVIFDPEARWRIGEHHSRSNYNPYEGLEVKGKIISTISRGSFIVKDGIFIGGEGGFLKRRL